jgi:hypothetical protein
MGTGYAGAMCSGFLVMLFFVCFIVCFEFKRLMALRKTDKAKEAHLEESKLDSSKIFRSSTV